MDSPGSDKARLSHLNPPPNPLFKGAIRTFGLSIATRLSLPANSSPASDDALSILRAVLFRLPSPEKVYRC